MPFSQPPPLRRRLALTGQPPRGFTTDGQRPLPAFVRGKTVVLTVPRRPDFVFYGWEPYTEGNLVNSAGLPASTFKLPVTPAR